MTFYDAYVGDLGDPDFSWENGNWNGNTPKALTLHFPQIGTRNLYFSVIDLVSSGRFEGGQVDWGGWVARVSKNDLATILDDWYGPEKAGPPQGMFPHQQKRLQEIRDLIARLDDTKTFALVGVEF